MCIPTDSKSAAFFSDQETHVMEQSGTISSTASSLIQGLKANDSAAWNRLAKTYSPLVYAWCRRSGLAPADVADVAQEVFLAVYRSIGGFRHGQPGDTFRGWLWQITRNAILANQRRHGDQPLAAGRYTVDLKGSSDQFELSDQTLTIHRGQDQVVRVNHVPRAVASTPSPAAVVPDTSPSVAAPSLGGPAGHGGPPRVPEKTATVGVPSEVVPKLLRTIGPITNLDSLQIALSPDGRHIAACEASWPLRILGTRTGEVLQEIPGGALSKVSFSPDGKLLAVSYNKANRPPLVVYRTADWRKAWRYSDKFFGAQFTAFSPDSPAPRRHSAGSLTGKSFQLLRQEPGVHRAAPILAARRRVLQVAWPRSPGHFAPPDPRRSPASASGYLAMRLHNLNLSPASGEDQAWKGPRGS